MTDAWNGLFGTAPVVVDGGLSTQLALLGEDTSGILWTGRVLLDNPAAVQRAHADFVAAGADVVITASYQVSRWGFEQAGMTADDADAALRASTVAARAAIAAVPGSDARVAASVGPYGAILHDGSEYRGRYGRTHRQLVDFHRRTAGRPGRHGPRPAGHRDDPGRRRGRRAGGRARRPPRSARLDELLGGRRRAHLRRAADRGGGCGGVVVAVASWPSGSTAPTRVTCDRWSSG